MFLQILSIDIGDFDRPGTKITRPVPKRKLHPQQNLKVLQQKLCQYLQSIFLTQPQPSNPEVNPIFGGSPELNIEFVSFTKTLIGGNAIPFLRIAAPEVRNTPHALSSAQRWNFVLLRHVIPSLLHKTLHILGRNSQLELQQIAQPHLVGLSPNQQRSFGL